VVAIVSRDGNHFRSLIARICVLGIVGSLAANTNELRGVRTRVAGP
jgi:hypothetical protein